MSTADFFHYSHALTRALPKSFEDSLKLEPPPEPIDLTVAARQHSEYTALLSTLVPAVVDIPADENHPDCVFVEDPVIVVGDTAIICRSGAPSRRGEVGPVRDAITQHLPLLRVEQVTEPATMDGGDVLFTGTELLIGLTARTNAAAVDQVSVVLAGKVAVRGVPMPQLGDKCLHLKSLMTAFDQDTLLVADTPTGRSVADIVRPRSAVAGAGEYDVVWVPDMLCSNCLRIGDTLVMQEGFPASQAVLEALCARKGVTLRTLCMAELAKADGALTCCSVLIKF